MHTLWHILTHCDTVYNAKHYFLTFWTKHHGLIPVIYWNWAVGLLNIQQIMKTSVTCALCCTAQYNTLRDEPSLQTFLFRHFFTKIRKIFTVRRKTRKLSKIRKTYAKNVRLDRYDPCIAFFSISILPLPVITNNSLVINTFDFLAIR